MFESRHQPLLSRGAYLARVARGAVFGGLMLALSLGVGVLGYRYCVGLGWIDALLNASMILTGMGPVSPIHTDAGKLFASGYALFSGIVFLASSGVVFAPVLHRFLHRFHVEVDDEADADDEPIASKASGKASEKTGSKRGPGRPAR